MKTNLEAIWKTLYKVQEEEEEDLLGENWHDDLVWIMHHSGKSERESVE